MQEDYIIITDSSANLTDDIIQKYPIEILSLNYHVEEKEYKSYIKGESVELSAFYSMMREKKVITTSLVNVEEAYILFENLLSQGKNIFYIGFSSGLGRSYQVVSKALEASQKKYPERKVYSVDSLAAALGEGLLVHYALKNQESGMSLEENVKWVQDNVLHVCHWFTVDDLFYLRRGGRISSATAIAGTALNIKPILHMDNEGHLIAMDKVMGRKKSLEALVDHMTETMIMPESQMVYISHGDCLEDAEYLADIIAEKLPVKREDILIHILDPVIGAHSGPGTVAVFFIGTER